MPSQSTPHPDAIPRTPLLLGLAGLLPFWGLSIGLTVSPVLGFTIDQIAFALMTYAALIVSFLGGVRWGLATVVAPVDSEFAAAIVPSLLAWGALALPVRGGLPLLGGVVLVLGWLDQALVNKGFAPRWFARLRLMLSVGAGIPLLLDAVLAARS